MINNLATLSRSYVLTAPISTLSTYVYNYAQNLWPNHHIENQSKINIGSDFISTNTWGQCKYYAEFTPQKIPKPFQGPSTVNTVSQLDTTTWVRAVLSMPYPMHDTTNQSHF